MVIVKESTLGVYVCLPSNISQMFIYRQGMTGSIYIVLHIFTGKGKSIVLCY